MRGRREEGPRGRAGRDVRAQTLVAGEDKCTGPSGRGGQRHSAGGGCVLEETGVGSRGRVQADVGRRRRRVCGVEGSHVHVSEAGLTIEEVE